MTKSNTGKQTGPLRVIKKSTCCKLSPTARGELTYHTGYNQSDKNFHIRVTENTGGGFFSNQWIGVDDVVQAIEALPSDDPFKATIFIPLYESCSSNNHGFLAAALRSEGVLDAVQDQPLSHVLGDVKAFKAAMNKLVKDKVDLHDDVAEAEAAKEEKRQEMIERMKEAANKKKEETTEDQETPPKKAKRKTAKKK